MPSDSDLDEVSPHVHAKIGVEKKIRWLKYAQEHHRGNLSSLVEEAVDNTISDNWVLASEAESDIDDLDIDLSGLEDIEELKSLVESLSTQIDDLALGDDADVGERLNRQERIRLGNQVLDNLPIVADAQDLQSLQSHLSVEPSERPKITGTAQDLANYLDEPEPHIREACIYLEREDDTVHSVIHDGTRRWYQVNPNASPASGVVTDDTEYPGFQTGTEKKEEDDG